MEKILNLNKFFQNWFNDLDCDDVTKSYIIGTLANYKSSLNDYSKDSVTILYAEAKYAQDFNKFQSIGDWLLLTEIFFPEHLKNASENYYNSLAQMSYYSCYILIHRKISVYEKLADEFGYLTRSARKIIQKY